MSDKEQEKKEEVQEEAVNGSAVSEQATDNASPEGDDKLVSSEEKKEEASTKVTSDKKEEAVSGSEVDESNSSAKEEVVATPKKKKRKVRRQVQKGKAFIRSTYNNTIITLADMHGNGLAWSSAGLLGFKGAKKATTYAANQVVLDVAEKVEKYGLSDLEIYVKGVGSGREAAIRGLAQKGFNLTLIKDTTPIPHNGCRPRKPRRV